MLSIDFIKENKKQVEQSIKKRGMQLDLDKLLELDKKRRDLIAKVEKLRASRNKISEVKGKPSSEQIEKATEIKNQLQSLEPDLKETEQQFNQLLARVPNLLHSDVPEGKDESDNKPIRKWGAPPKFNFEPKDHVELGKKLDIIDTKKSAKISGARFCYLKNEAVLIQFALVQYTLNVLTSEKQLKKISQKVQKNYPAKPFIPVVPPVMIRPQVFKKMARLNKEDKEEKYYFPKDNIYLIGSAEHTLGPLHMNETIKEEKLPLRYLGYSTAFRREAGSYGKDTRGILRVHQFDKLEMESFTSSDDSFREQEFFIAIQEHLMQQLKIPYQVVAICTADMGKPDFRQVDVEAWIPSQEKYRETHTSDLMTDYQSRRLNTKVKKKDGTAEFVHMNDATAFAIGRTLIAILENYQKKNGSIEVPKALQKYLSFKVIRPK